MFVKIFLPLSKINVSQYPYDFLIHFSISGIVLYAVGCHSHEAIHSYCVPSMFWGDSPALGGEVQDTACLPLHVIFDQMVDV